MIAKEKKNKKARIITYNCVTLFVLHASYSCLDKEEYIFIYKFIKSFDNPESTRQQPCIYNFLMTLRMQAR